MGLEVLDLQFGLGVVDELDEVARPLRRGHADALRSGLGQFAGPDAGGEVVRLDFHQRRQCGGAGIEARPAAGREAAAGRRIEKAGRQALDGLELVGAGPVEARHRAQEPDGVGMAGAGEDVLRRALLDHLAGIHDVDAVGIARHHAEIVGDDDQRDAEAPRQILHQLEDLGLDGDVEGGRGLVGDDQLGVAGEPDGDHHALAHAAGELVRVLAEAALGIGQADELQEFDGARPGVLPGDVAMHEQGFGDLVADGEHRVQRGHRLLEDHRDLLAAQLAHLAFAEAEEVAALEQDLPVRHPAGGLGQQAHDAQRRHRLAAARLAHQGDDLAGADIIGDAFDGPDDAARGDEMDMQVANREQGGAGPCDRQDVRRRRLCR
jgi:hypothetical protein